MVGEFNGKISLDIRDSEPDWTPFTLKEAPVGAPNVLVVLYDDTGMASWSPYGGRILGVGIDVGDDQYIDLELEAMAAFVRD